MNFIESYSKYDCKTYCLVVGCTMTTIYYPFNPNPLPKLNHRSKL